MRTRRLIVVSPEGERELLFIGRLTVGRAPECDISLADTKASRRHAEFDGSGPVPRVTDLGSRNGILVNGRKVGGADLSPGDVVTVGDARIRFEEQISEAHEVSRPSPALDDRTAVLPPAMPPAPPAAPPPVVAPVPVPAPAPAPVSAPAPDPVPAAPVFTGTPLLSSDPDKTTVLPPRTVPANAPPTSTATPPVPVPTPDPIVAAPVFTGTPLLSSDPDKTTVLPPRTVPAIVTPPPVAAPMAAEPAAVEPPPPPVPASPTAVPAAPAAAAVAAPPPTPAAGGPPVPVAPAPAPAPAAATAPLKTVGQASQGGPRFSWAGLLTILCIVLGGVGVLLGALPLLSATAASLDALSSRQARTLGVWLSNAVSQQGTVDERIVDAVSSQTGVVTAVILDGATRRAIAPRRMIGRPYPELPSVGAAWPGLSAAQLNDSGDVIDAFVPVSGAAGSYVAWVRYERPSGREGGIAVVVALVSTLIMALLVSILIKRQTGITMRHFTRQVELAVSGADPKIMQGGLLPGLERLPGVVTYLMEQRASSAPAPVSGGGPSTSAAPVAPPPEEPVWIEVTPSLAVVAASRRGPASGVASWESVASKHLLDVLQQPGLRNAVVQGLGALSMKPGADVTIPVPDDPLADVHLRREPSGNVRVTLGTR